MKRKLNFADFFYKYGLYLVFVVLIIVFSVANPRFISLGNIRNILQQSSAAGVAVVGLACVMLTGGIDISLGSVMYFTANIVVFMIDGGVIPDNLPGIFLSLVAALLIGGALGAFNGLFVAAFKIPPLIVTIATYSFFRGITYTINQVKGMYFNNYIGDTIGRGKIGEAIPIVVIILAIILLAGQFTLKYTPFGRQLYAIGNNEMAAEKVGIRVNLIKFIVYVIGGATAGLSGLLLGAQTNSVLTGFAQDSHFTFISAAVLGGISLFGGVGNIFPGAFLGVLIVICIENGLIFLGANPYLYTIVRGLVIFVAVALDCVRFKGETR